MMTALHSLLTGSLLIAILSACSGGSSAASTTPPPEVDVTVTAEANEFDSNSITISAGEVITVFFENLDGQPPNIAICTDASASESLFVGDLITGSSMTYEIPALEPGEYFFRCYAHPAMTGIAVVEG